MDIVFDRFLLQYDLLFDRFGGLYPWHIQFLDWVMRIFRLIFEGLVIY
jgi:hypothetical protein